MLAKLQRRTSCFGAPLVLALLPACAQFTPPVDPDEQPLAGDAFVYGRFKLGSSPGQTIGLTLTCTDGNQYCMRFEVEHPVEAIKVTPSTCWVTSVAFVDWNGRISGRQTFERGILDNMRFDAGNAYYIGDFWGEVTLSDSSSFGQSASTVHWKLENLHDYYQNATTSLFIHYPKLSRVHTVDQLQLSAPPLPRESEP